MAWLLSRKSLRSGNKGQAFKLKSRHYWSNSQARAKKVSRDLHNTPNQVLVQGTNSHSSGRCFSSRSWLYYCGYSCSLWRFCWGSYASTITVTDIASTWTLNRAIRSKTQEEVKNGISKIEAALPFPMKAFKSDCGSEFMNRTLFEHFVKRRSPVLFFEPVPTARMIIVMSSRRTSLMFVAYLDMTDWIAMNS